MALGMQTGFSLKELGASMITAGIGGGMAAKFPTLSNTPLLQRLLKNGVTVLTAQLAEVSLNLRHDIDPRAIAAQMLGATMGEDISAQLGDSVADQATAAALSTASSAVLGSAITHTPLDAENLAETMLGTAIGTSIGAKFAPKPGEDLLGNKYTTKHVLSLTKQAQTQQKQQRSATAAENKHDDLHQPHKPKGPKHKLYDPSNDPEILKAEAVANMSLPSAGIDLNPDAVGKQQAIYNASATQRVNWQVDHSTWGEMKRAALHNYHEIHDTIFDFRNKIIEPMSANMDQEINKTNFLTKYSPYLAKAYNVLAMPSTIQTNFVRGIKNLSVNFYHDVATPGNRVYALTTAGLNLLENTLTDGALTAVKIATVSKLGLFASKSASVIKATSLGKSFSLAGMFAGTVKNNQNFTIDILQKYSKQVVQYSKLNNVQLEKAIISHKKQIILHKDKLENPHEHVSNWSKLSQEHKKNLIHHWENDISRHDAYSEIAKNILNKRIEEELKNGK